MVDAIAAQCGQPLTPAQRYALADSVRDMLRSVAEVRAFVLPEGSSPATSFQPVRSSDLLTGDRA